MAVACVAITDCITSLPSLSSTATEIVLWWTSRPIYLMLSIGCSFRQAWFTASHSNQILLRKGRPFIMRAPHEPPLLVWEILFWHTYCEKSPGTAQGCRWVGLLCSIVTRAILVTRFLPARRLDY